MHLSKCGIKNPYISTFFRQYNAKILIKYVFDIKIEYKRRMIHISKSILYAWAKQYNTRYGQFGFYWNVEELGLGIMLDWSYGRFSLHVGPFYFLWLFGNYSEGWINPK